MTAKFTLDRNTHKDIQNLLEDTAGYFCDEYGISAELFYICMECFAQAKQNQLAQLKAAL